MAFVKPRTQFSTAPRAPPGGDKKKTAASQPLV
jgi:hypothetical protein